MSLGLQRRRNGCCKGLEAVIDVSAPPSASRHGDEVSARTRKRRVGMLPGVSAHLLTGHVFQPERGKKSHLISH